MATTVTQTMTLSRQIAHGARELTLARLTPEVIAKVKTCLLDMIGCALECRDLPWSKQAIEIASRTPGGKSTIIGTPYRVAPSEAAFVNAILGHGLVREDMHTRSVSHLGIVIFPSLLALAQRRPVTGEAFILGTVCGYEIGGAVGGALADKDFVRLFRPTGTSGPIGAAGAGSVLLGLSEDAIVSAVGLAANTVSGFNEWPYAGADEMFFHAGFAARNAVAAVELAELGAFISETALDGRAGLFAALNRSDRVSAVAPFTKDCFEIMSVFHKPAPACNYAQTPSQAALALASQDGVQSKDIASIRVKCTAAAVAYPGCNSAGPFERILQAKMSIHYCVAATLVKGKIDEENYRVLTDPEILRLVAATTIETDPGFTSEYPRLQGAEVVVTLRDGRVFRQSLPDVMPATAADVKKRFKAASEKVLGAKATRNIEEMVDGLEKQKDVGALVEHLSVS